MAIKPHGGVNEGRTPSKQSPKMKAMADKAEQDAVEERNKPKTKVKEDVDHEAEAKRYDRLAKEAHNQTTSAQTPEYYTKKAAEHRSKIKKETGRPTPKTKMEESNMAVKGLAFLVESELEKAQVVIAAKSILDKLQKMAEDVAKIEADDIMPMLDSMRLTFGPELTDSFNDVTTGRLRQTTEAIKGAKEAITKEVGRLENNVNGEETNDMGMEDDLGGDLGDELGGDDLGMEGGDDMGLGDVGPDTEQAPEAPDGAEDLDGGPSDDLDSAFDAAAADTAAGRAKKESIQRNIKALSESANPDRLVFETFRRTLKESKDAVRAARAVASAFSIDFQDVVSIVKEGKTWKDQKGRKDKNDDRRQDRKDKKRDRPSDLDEAKQFGSGLPKNAAPPFGKRKPEDKPKGPVKNEDELEEGKTWKDQKDRKDKNDDRSQDRKDKKRDRPSDIDEAKQFGSGVPKKAAPPFGKRKPEDRPKGPVSNEGGKVVNEFEMKPTPASKKGMFDGKTEVELKKELAALKKTGPHKEGSKEFTKEKELNFAIRAKSGWKKTDESKGFKTGAVAEGQRNAVASTRQKTMESMSLEDAKKIVGRTNSTEPFLSRMIKALSMHPWLNSDEENARLEAAKIVKASMRKRPVREEDSEDRKTKLKRMGFNVVPMATTPDEFRARRESGGLKWFWKNERPEAQAKRLHIQDGTSASEQDAWKDLESTLEKRGMNESSPPDLIKSREEALARAKKARADKGFGAMERAKKPTGPVEESKKGVKVLLMKDHEGTTPKTKPFSKPAKFPRK
jgi:hypothetical protein